jgi:membrane-bound inhibitor of C-type lysozyme/uncharacterized membrane protein
MKSCVVLLLCWVTTACAGGFSFFDSNAQAGDFIPDSRPLATTLVYDCDGYQFSARIGPGETALWLPEGYVVLSQVRSPSGTLYEEGDVSFWSHNSELLLYVGERSYQNCQLRPELAPWEDARLRGIDFRAVGDTPHWSLEIRQGQQLFFIGESATQRVVVPDVDTHTDAAMRSHHGTTAAHDLGVTILAAPCSLESDTATTYPNQVAVTLDGATYMGCGQDLERLPEPQQ